MFSSFSSTKAKGWSEIWVFGCTIFVPFLSHSLQIRAWGPVWLCLHLTTYFLPDYPSCLYFKHRTFQRYEFARLGIRHHRLLFFLHISARLFHFRLYQAWVEVLADHWSRLSCCVFLSPSYVRAPACRCLMDSGASMGEKQGHVQVTLSFHRALRDESPSRAGNGVLVLVLAPIVLNGLFFLAWRYTSTRTL